MKTFLRSLFNLFNNRTFLNSVLLHLPVCSTVKRCFSQKKKTTKTQNCNINKPVSVLFGKVINYSYAITPILGEVINPYATANVLSIAQTSQTSECNVEQSSVFMQK